MTMLRLPVSDLPIDLMLLGEVMRDAALAWPMTGAVGLTGATGNMALVASVNTPSSLMAGLSAFPPRASDVAMTFAGRAIHAEMMAARANGGMCNSDGMTLPFTRTNTDLMTCYTPQSTGLWVLAIQTQDSTGAPLGNCRVVVLDVGRIAVGAPTVIAEMVSDGSGNANVSVPQNTDYMVLAYLPGSPDRAGVSVQTLSPDPA
jgi:hypothetical protein